VTWCQKEGVPDAIITLCGSEIVTGHEREISAKIRAMAIERGIEVRIAYDGMKRREDARTRAGRMCALQKLREICIRLWISFARSALECGESSHLS
jgi:hypothetical protein